VTYDPPLRDDLRGAAPYGAPQLDVPVRLNTNENPFPPSPALAEAIGQAAARAALGLNRYPDREARELRQRLADYLDRESGVRLDARDIWVANGSNEVMQHVFAAFGGPGRMALGFSPTYSMYEQYARDTFTRYVTVRRNPDFTLDATTVVAAMLGGSPSIVVLTSPNNPTGTSLPLEVAAGGTRSLSGRGRRGLRGVLHRGIVGEPTRRASAACGAAYALEGARAGRFANRRRDRRARTHRTVA